MSTKYQYPMPGPEIGVWADHPRYGEVLLRDKLESDTDSFWIIEDLDGELHIADEEDMSRYHVR